MWLTFLGHPVYLAALLDRFVLTHRLPGCTAYEGEIARRYRNLGELVKMLDYMTLHGGDAVENLAFLRYITRERPTCFDTYCK